MLDWFSIGLIASVLLAVVFVLFAIRRMMGEITGSGVSDDEARKLAELIRARDIRCLRCNQQSSALLGTKNRYKCDLCNYEFEGPEHIEVS